MENKSKNLKKKKDGYGYKYVELAQINDYCEQNGIEYYQYIEVINDNDYIMTTIKENDVWLEPRRGCRVVQATLQGIKNPAQEQGSSITYSRRYSLLMALGLATEDNDAKGMTIKEDKTINIKLHAEFQKLLIESETDLEELLKHYGVKDSTELTESQFNEAIVIMKKKVNK